MIADESAGGERSGEGDGALTASAIAERVRGRLLGDGSTVVTSVAPLERAGPTDLSFLASARHAGHMARSTAAVVFVSEETAAAAAGVPARIVVEDPREALASVLPLFHRAAETTPGVHPTAVLGRGVRLGRDVAIGPYVVLGDDVTIGDRARLHAQCVIGDGVQIGEDARLYPGVTCYAGSRLGARVVLHSGARVGSDGFGYVSRDGVHTRVPHVGRCLIGDDVEIGANCTIDRGSIDDTIIGAGTKLDNLVHVAHNVHIGRHCLILAQVGLSGSVHVGDGCIIAGQAGLAGHNRIGDGAIIGAQAGVLGDVPAGETWSGYPARPHRQSLRTHAALFKLTGWIRDIERLVQARTG